MIGVADSIEAMLSDRPYRKGFDVPQVKQVLYENRGVQWDPDIVDVALSAKIVETGRELLSDSEYAHTVDITPAMLHEAVKELRS